MNPRFSIGPCALALCLSALCSGASLTPDYAFAAAEHSAGNAVDLSIVGIPILSDGRLVNYVMVRVSLIVRPGTDVNHLSEKEPYFREALAHLGFRTPLNPPNSLNRVDPALIKAKMLPLCREIVGSDVVTGVEIKYQEPQKRLAPPHPAAAAPPRPGA